MIIKLQILLLFTILGGSPVLSFRNQTEFVKSVLNSGDNKFYSSNFFNEDPALVIAPVSYNFKATSLQQFTITLDNNSDIADGDVTVANEAEVADYLTHDTPALAQDKKSVTLTVTPTGKPGSATLKINYKGKNPKDLPLTFGDPTVAIKPGIAAPASMILGDPAVAININADPAIQPGEITAPDNKIIKITPGGAAGNLTLSLEGIAPGEAPVKINIKGFTYTLKDKLKVQDKLTGIVLYDNDQKVNRQVMLDTTSRAASIKVDLLARQKRSFEIRGKFQSGKEEKISWLGPPTVQGNDFSVASESGDGNLIITGSSTPSKTTPPPPNSIEYSILPPAAQEFAIDNNLKKFKIDITVTATDYFIQLLTYQSDNILLANGKIKIIGSILNANNAPIGGPIVFAIKETKNQIWVNLANEGTSATLSWRSPSPDEIRTAYHLGATDALPLRPNEIVVSAKANPPSSPEITSEITIRMAEIKNFTKLKVKLNVMDDRTASDLYGTVTAKEYYVLNVRLNNNLKDEQTNQPTGDSIIAYSGSMEIAVTLEKKFLENSGSAPSNIITQKDIDEVNKQITTISGDSNSSPFDSELKKAQEEVERLVPVTTVAINEFNKQYAKYNEDRSNYTELDKARTKYNDALDSLEMAWGRVYTVKENMARWRYMQRTQANPVLPNADGVFKDGKWHLVTKEDFRRFNPAFDLPDFQSFRLLKRIPKIPTPDELTKARKEAETTPASADDPENDVPCTGTLTYRPLTFEMVVNTVDRRDSRSLRSKVFKLLDLIGTGTSFVTAVAVPPASSDLPLGLEKFSNLLMPGLDKLFPSLKEQNRQNIVAQTMKPIEEIPYGSDITRVVFVPKKPINGLILGHATRISEICPFYFKIEVAVIKNAGTVQQGRIP